MFLLLSFYFLDRDLSLGFFTFFMIIATSKKVRRINAGLVQAFVWVPLSDPFGVMSWRYRIESNDRIANVDPDASRFIQIRKVAV